MKTKKLMVFMAVSALILSGCNHAAAGETVAATESMESETVLETEMNEATEYTEDEVAQVFRLSNDRYVLVDSENVDMIHYADYEKDVVTDVSVDVSDVDWGTSGTYPVTYHLKIDTKAMETFLQEKSLEESAASADETDAEPETDSSMTETDTESRDETAAEEETIEAEKTEETMANDTKSTVASEAESSGTSETSAEDDHMLYTVDVKSDVTIVDMDKADMLSEEDVKVLTDNNEVYTPEAEADTDETKEADSDKNAEKKEDSSKETDPVKTVDKSGDKKEQSTGGSSVKQPETQAPQTQSPQQPETQAPQTPSPQQPETQAPQTQAPQQPETQAPQTQAPQQPPETQHTHTWVAQEKPVYEWRTICNGCGADITNNLDHIYECGPGSYRNEQVQTGTQCSCAVK